MIDFKKLLLALLAALRAAWAIPPTPPPAPAPPAPPAPDPDPIPPDPDEPDEPDVPPSDTTIWKPISDNEGRLAIVTGARWEFKKVIVRYGAGNKKEEAGRYTGRANGNRQHWRYSKKGGQYGKNIIFVGVEEDGKEQVWKVPDGKARYEFRRK